MKRAYLERRAIHFQREAAYNASKVPDLIAKGYLKHALVFQEATRHQAFEARAILCKLVTCKGYNHAIP